MPSNPRPSSRMWARGTRTTLQSPSGLAGVANQKKGLIQEGDNTFAQYRPDLSSKSVWKLAGARFFVVSESSAGGVVFAASHRYFTLLPTRARQEAEAAAAAWGKDARVFAVRPDWSLPTKDWIAGDPDFWRTTP